MSESRLLRIGVRQGYRFKEVAVVQKRRCEANSRAYMGLA